jgi:hypothetical protein
MREVKIEELEIGDEIVIACQAYFKYLRVLVKPSIGPHLHWSTKRPMYKSVKCSTRRDVILHVNGYERKEWIFSPEDHNHVQYIDLECRQVLLVNRP